MSAFICQFEKFDVVVPFVGKVKLTWGMANTKSVEVVVGPKTCHVEVLLFGSIARACQ